jgi:hypothetical protein
MSLLYIKNSMPIMGIFEWDALETLLSGAFKARVKQYDVPVSCMRHIGKSANFH